MELILDALRILSNAARGKLEFTVSYAIGSWIPDSGCQMEREYTLADLLARWPIPLRDFPADTPRDKEGLHFEERLSRFYSREAFALLASGAELLLESFEIPNHRPKDIPVSSLVARVVIAWSLHPLKLKLATSRSSVLYAVIGIVLNAAGQHREDHYRLLKDAVTRLKASGCDVPGRDDG